MESNYRKPYPRPFPCGTFVIGFDRRHVQVLGHALFIETGLCEVSLLADGVPCTLQVFTDMQADRLWLRLVDADGEPMASPFDRVRLIPDPDTFSSRFVADGAVAGMPHPAPVEGLPQGSLAFRQVLPYQVPEQYDLAAGHPKDRAFCLSLSVIQPLEHRVRENTVSGVPKPMDDLERGLVSPEHPERMSAAQRRPQSKDAGFVACVQLDHGLASDVTGPADLPAATAEGYDAARDDAAGSWEDYWRRSGVKLSDRELERAWYRNLYFLNCAVRTGVTCPGLFANWSYKNIGTAWHGDYHMNYNTQQPFWVTFSSNHVDKHLPYVDLVDFLRPISRQWARDYYGMRGAFFPHSAYPVDMTMFPYPVPTWGWEVCETPWTVQSLWWHYLYTQDRDFLAARAFEPIKESVLFLVDYMTRPEAHGAGWGDDRYHVFPTVSPELYGLTPGFRMNRDCIADLTLIRFVFNAYLQACDILGLADAETETVAAVREILARFPEYPTAESQRGTVWVSVPGEHPEIVYNCATSTMPIFPGEEVGLGSPREQYELAATTYRNQSNEGGNDLVFLNVQGARLGLLDLDRFRRQLRYCLLPNGTHSDLAMQALGRYSDTTAFDFMVNMGIWFENFAVPFVINECLLQSYDGTLRLFPNWPLDERAEFHTLRAVGAFLVSAACADGQVQWVRIESEAGAPLKMVVPWAAGAEVTRGDGTRSLVAGPLLELDTVAGETVTISPLAS
jgi:alpha-L-fucosidase 2